MAIYKRGSKWWMSFQHNGSHIQKSTGCTGKRDAEAFERAFRTQLVKGEIGLTPKPEVPDFERAMHEFLDWCRVEHRAKPNTLRSYENTSRPLLAFFHGKTLHEIDVEAVERFKVWRSKQRTRPRRTHSPNQCEATSAYASRKKSFAKELAPATVNRELALLKMFFNHLIRRDVATRNPVCRVKFLSEDNRSMRVVSISEERLYLIAATQPLRDIATIMIDTGMRPSEIVALRRDDIKLEKRTAQVQNGKTKAARRRIPLTSRAVEVLQRRTQGLRGTDFLFLSEKTMRPLTTCKTAHATALRKTGVRHFRLYDLRHTFATRFVDSGGDVMSLQALLGHSNIQMVTRYAHPTQDHQAELIRRMELDRDRQPQTFLTAVG